MRPYLYWIAGILSAAALIFGLPATTQGQQDEPPAPVKPASASIATTADDVATPQVDSDKFFENDFLRVYFNDKGQFVIVAREEITKSEVPLLYPGLIHEISGKSWSSYATVRYRYLNTPADDRKRGETKTYHTSAPARVTQLYVDANGDRAQIVYELPRDDEDIAANGSPLPSPLHICGMYLTQSLSFMTNPFTGRQDMVRIRYTLEHEKVHTLSRCSTENNSLGDVAFSLRLLLDTQVGAGDTDEAYLLTPGPGTTPDYLRIFETGNMAVTDWQALIDLSSTHQPGRPQATVSTGEWGAYHTDTEDTYQGATAYEDSAVAVRWDGLLDPWAEVFEIGYGLAPAGGGESWIDAPAVLPGANALHVHAYTTNPRNAATLINGTVTLSLPPSMTVPIAVAGATISDLNSWEAQIGDLEAETVKHVGWDVEVDGPPGRYVYTTTTRFDNRPASIVTNSVELKQSFGFSNLQTIVPEGNPTAGTVSYEIPLEIRRYNSDGKRANVTFATAQDIGSANGALANSDYYTASQVLIFEGNEITKTVTVTLLDDSEAESAESILLTLSNPSAGAVVLDQGKALLTIVDNDEAIHTNYLNLPAVVRQ